MDRVYAEKFYGLLSLCLKQFTIKLKFLILIKQKKEINTLLGDIIRHIQPDRIFESFYSQLQSIASKILIYITDYSVLFSLVSL